MIAGPFQKVMDWAVSWHERLSGEPLDAAEHAPVEQNKAVDMYAYTGTVSLFSPYKSGTLQQSVRRLFQSSMYMRYADRQRR